MALLHGFKPKGYLIATLITSIGGFLNGFDTGSIGAITEMSSFSDTFGQQSPFLRGFTVSLLMLTGSIPSFLAGYLSDKYGRLAIAGLGASIFLLGVVLEGAARQLGMFLVGRALAGIGEGFWLGCVTVYVSEIAPSAIRGRLVSVGQFYTTVGVCAGYFVCYGSVKLTSSLSWRIPFILQAILAFVLAIGCAMLPSSPRWLVLHGRRDEAIRAVERLGIEREEAEKDILAVTGVDHEQLDKGYWQGITAIFRKQYRKRTSLALLVLGAAQLSGIDGVLYYAPTLFAQAGLPSQTAGFLASGVSAILMLVITIPAVILADRIGRRVSVLSGGIIMTACMYTIGSLYASSGVHAGHGVGRWVVVVAIFVIALTYCATWAVAAKLYASEIQPARTRASANSVAQGMSFFCNWLVAFATPIFLAKSNSGVYFLFGSFSLVTVLIMAIFMPETKGVPLEQIHQAFEQPVLSSFHLPTNPLRRRAVARIDSDSHTTSTSINPFNVGSSTSTAGQGIQLNTLAKAPGVGQKSGFEIAGVA